MAHTNTDQFAPLSMTDMRTQIIENCEVLWPFVEAESHTYCQPFDSKPPAFQVITYGSGTSIIAEVIWGIDQDQDDMKNIFIQSKKADNAQKALANLLKVTMAMIDKYHNEYIVANDLYKWVDMPGGGYYVRRE